MKNVLWIGKYNRYGVFDSNNWKQFMVWIKKKCDKIDIYSNINPIDMRGVFGSDKVVNEYVFEGMENYHSYEILCDDDVLELLSTWNYNINLCNISHIYFYSGDKEYGYIYISDLDNFVILDVSDVCLNELINMLGSVQENINKCVEYKYDVNEIVQDDWLPIGI